ncbi:MAG: hypothetical protein PHW77_09395, partial [Eubacteriales bacterium]|nr:hypothetical protein [Eubacteriales bacterium]
DIDWEHVADKGFVMLGWLEYSLRRSLCMECADSEEQNMGTNHVFSTLENLSRYETNIPKLLHWIYETV